MKRGRAILVIDDQETNRAIIKEIFKKEYDVLEADNGFRGLELLQENANRIQAILLDIMMPRMDGFSFMARLKDAKMNNYPIIVVTAENSHGNEIKMLDMGAVDIIGSPFNSEVVRRRVDNSIYLYEYRKILENKTKELMYNLQKSNDAMVDTLLNIIEHRSLESAQHTRRMRKYVETLLNELKLINEDYKLDKSTIDVIARASTMHDIGKIVIPDKILNKKGKLTSEEYEIIKTHAAEGGEIVKKFAESYNQIFLEYAYKIARCHHERWDGNGYPDKLRGDEIPLCAQVAGIADVYDALTVDRVYKKAYSHDKAINMIINDECGVFSPEMKRALSNASEKLRVLAKNFYDGKMKFEDITQGKEDNVIISREDFRADYYKCETLLKMMGGMTIEVDFDADQYKVISKRKIGDTLPEEGVFSQAINYFLEQEVAPDDRERTRNDIEVFRKKVMNNSLPMEETVLVVNVSGRGKKCFRFLRAQLDEKNSLTHKALFLFKSVDGN